MKKLIAIAVVLVLAVGAAFAAEVSGTVFGTVKVIEGDSGDGSDITAGGGMGRVRIDASGEAGDGKFGGFIRLQSGDFTVNSAYAYWKPIDQFKLIIGNWDDGIWGKEGVTGWMFNQMPQSDNDIATNPGIWFGDGWGSSIYGNIGPMHSRYTFFEGFNETGAAMEIKPLDILGVNLAIPFITQAGIAEDVFKAVIAQVDVNLDFGNIALTYDGNGRAVRNTGDAGGLFLYYGGSFGDLGLDVGFSYHLTAENADAPPIGLGLGLKYASGAFGIKFKLTAALGGDDEVTYLNTSLVPYYAINDNISAFLNAGLGIVAKDDDSFVGFFVNPYLRVGAEWGPSFYFGFELASGLAKDGKDFSGNDVVTTFKVPIAIVVSF